MKKKAILLIILLVAIFAGVYGYKIYKEKHSKKYLTLYGNVDIREVNLSFRVAGLIKSMKYEEGGFVKNGETIATLDDSQYLDQLNEASAQVDVKKSELDKLLAGTRVEEVAQAKALVKEREATLANAQYHLDLNKKGLQTGVVAQQEFENSQKQLDEAQARLSSSREALLEALNGPVKEDIGTAKAGLKVADAKVSNIKKTVSYTSLIAPSDGTVLTRIKEPGSYVNAGEAVYSVSLTTPKWVQAYIDEKNLGKIRSGMSVTIKNDTYPDKTYTGTIGFISPTAEFTPKTVETPELRASLVYRFRVNVKDDANELRQGMPVTLEIKTNAKPSDKN